MELDKVESKIQQFKQQYKPVSNFAKYIWEREEKFCEENDISFATYTLSPEYVYIEDLYVCAERRKDYQASKIADIVTAKAAKMGIPMLIGSVSLDDINSTRNTKVLLGYHMQVSHICERNNMIYFKKEIL